MMDLSTQKPNPSGIKKCFKISVWHRHIPQLDGEVTQFISDNLVQKLNEINRDGHIGYFTIERMEAQE